MLKNCLVETKAMKQQLKRQIRWWGLSLIVVLASLNLGTQTNAQTLHFTDVVLLSETNTNSLAPKSSAHELLRSAYEKRYTWSSQFPGYTAAVEVKQGKEDYRGHIRVNSDLSVEVTGIDTKDARETVENQLRMLIVHRRRIPFDVAHKNSTFKLGTTDKTGAVEIIEQGDKAEASYKVFNQQVIQVNRLIGPHSFIVDTLDFKVTPEGYMSTRYRTTLLQPQTKQVLGEEVSEDTYTKIGEYYLPTRQVIQHSEGGKQYRAEFNFTDIQLLSGQR